MVWSLINTLIQATNKNRREHWQLHLIGKAEIDCRLWIFCCKVWLSSEFWYISSSSIRKVAQYSCASLKKYSKRKKCYSNWWKWCEWRLAIRLAAQLSSKCICSLAAARYTRYKSFRRPCVSMLFRRIVFEVMFTAFEYTRTTVRQQV